MRQRRLSQPAFHRERLKGYAAIMTAMTSEWLEKWDQDARFRNGQTIDLHSEVMQLTLAIVSKALYSADLRSDAGSISELASAMVNMFRVVTLPFAEQILKLPLPASRRFQAAKQRLDALMYGIIAERRASGEDRGDLLSMLLLAQDNEGDGSGMSDEQLRDEILTLFLAGHETTANALSWTWYLLATHPEAERSFFEELDGVLGGRTPTLDDLESLRFTYALLAESMRLYPPAWRWGAWPEKTSRWVGTHFRLVRWSSWGNGSCTATRAIGRTPRVSARALADAGGAPEDDVLPLWRWRAPVHWRTVCVDGGSSVTGTNRTAVAISFGARCAHRATATDHFTVEVWAPVIPERRR